MPEIEYRSGDEIPDDLSGFVFRDLRERRWRVAALVIHRNRTTGKETERVAYLRRADPGSGTEWEIPVAGLDQAVEVEQ
ncbi:MULTISPECIES: hypothetical protein [unclassified Streptomyces]|uniref:hypothetical protein n=1 Tax=unclassified Streptomyces TaxID=2593676 RepID=UPI0037F72691